MQTRRKFIRSLGTASAALAGTQIIPGFAMAGFIIDPYKFSSGQKSAMTLLTEGGLTSNLQFCLDAGDSASVASGSQTKWLDRSGNGQDFWRGHDSGSANNPTFNGTPGGLSSSEYWSFDNDFFQYDASNEAWMNAMHKENAAFTLACWIYFGSFTAPETSQSIFSTYSFENGPGIYLYITNSTGVLNLDVYDGSDVDVTSSGVGNSASTALGAGAWMFIALSVDEANSSIIVQVNGVQNIFASGGTHSAVNYVSPSSSNAGEAFRMGARDNEFPDETERRLSSGSRMAQALAWSRALSASEMELYFNLSRGRYGV